jgi:hypothetical protein
MKIHNIPTEFFFAHGRVRISESIDELLNGE